MKGKLYGVGVGPGDPELITVKARRILEEVEVVAAPRPKGETEGSALKIVGDFVQGKSLLELSLPMTQNRNKLIAGWQNAACDICRELEGGKDVAFITLGYPAIYSTFMYICRIVEQEGYAVEIIPGVPSFCAAAAKAGINLSEGSETLAVVPGTAGLKELEEILARFDTIVVMKASSIWGELKAKLDAGGLLAGSVLVERCGMEGECVIRGSDINGCINPDYFSTLIVKKNGVEHI